MVEVAQGYARNYLIPQGKAMEATRGNLAPVDQAKAKQAQVQARGRKPPGPRSLIWKGWVTLAQRVGEGERLYGSVTPAMIAEALAAQGFEVDRKDLELAEPIKKLGTYEVACAWPRESGPTVTVQVVPEAD